MSVKIFNVAPLTAAAKKGVEKDDIIVSINGNPINDVLDYDFYAAEPVVKLEIIKKNGKKKNIKIKKDEYEDIGLEFESYLIDSQHHCKNNCIFCFIDQMPKGMRETLYFKDDDDRLSFIFGNYITLTNLPREEIDRIIKMHISPINISVHTTNPELRVKMMKNPFAGQSLEYMTLLAENGIKMNCQLVLCPGINDGDELKKTLNDLSRFFPSIESVACVPVGLTDHREGLTPLEPYNAEQAAAVLDIVVGFGDKFKAENGIRLVYPADEFFIKAKRDIPDAEFYDDFQQLENGVGMVALQRQEFEEALKFAEIPTAERSITAVTGVDAAPFIQILVDELKEKWHNFNCRVIAVENEFFGKNITVAGLLTAGDIIKRLKGEELGSELLIPSCMLRHEQDKFLDDITLDEFKAAVGVKVRLCENDGQDVLDAFLGLD